MCAALLVPFFLIGVIGLWTEGIGLLLWVFLLPFVVIIPYANATFANMMFESVLVTAGLWKKWPDEVNYMGVYSSLTREYTDTRPDVAPPVPIELVNNGNSTDIPWDSWH